MRMFIVAGALTLVLLAQSASQSKVVEVAGNQAWTDTGLDVRAGDLIKINVAGEVTYRDGGAATAEGLKRGWRDLIRSYPLNDYGRGALIGRIGETRPFFVGSRRESRAPTGGRLYLGLNQAGNDAGEGSFKATIEVAAGEAARVDRSKVRVTEIPRDILAKLPARVKDADGLEGDRVNFLIVGGEEQIKLSLANAGWVVVDRSVRDTVLRGALATFSKQAYVTLPMSELLLFDRPQDYGYAMGDPVQVVAARHHFRLWKTPYEVGGRPLWAGAGTHDIGFDRDQRNGKLTHKIDSDTDKEREFIGQSLEHTGNVAKLDYYTPPKPIKEARTAHGQTYYSDGRILLVYMMPDGANAKAEFADMFCSVLKQRNPDGGEWGECTRWMAAPGRENVALGAPAGQYRLLIVPGIMSSCFRDSPAFAEGHEAVKKLGIGVEVLVPPNDSSESNAKLIADYLKPRLAGSASKYIVVGYSKGAPDVQEMLARYPEAAKGVAAFVSVAGASGGSPIADAIPALAEGYVNRYKFSAKCEGNLAEGFKSLRQDTRRRFLETFPHPLVPTYSLAAVSDASTTSKMLLQGWKLMNAFSKTHDGQLTKADATVPESKLLGEARADHLAVALPFDKSEDAALKAGMDKGRYPRGALLEALVRFVIQDLEGGR